jgi:peptide/nickel transport system substrate-binding protein
MRTDDVRRASFIGLNRRDFIRTSAAGLGAAAVVGTSGRRASAAPASYPDWIPRSDKAAKRGGTIARASQWDPPLIDPRLTQSVGTFQFVSLTSSRLVRYVFSDEASGPADLTLKGDLAESWQASPDHRVWTFKLRQGVKWHNMAPVSGREFVAADVKYCFEQYAKEGVQSFNFQEIEGIETPDKYTVRLHLNSPNVLLAQNLAEPIAVLFAREVLEKDGDLKKTLIGTGPYMLKEHTRKVRIVLQRNPDYFVKGAPNIDEYTILSTPDAATRLAAFRTGQADFIWVASPSEVETIRKTNANAVIQSYHNTLAPWGLTLAQDRAPFNDVRVRRAISMAIDRQKMVDTVFEGHGIPGWGVPYIYYTDKQPTLAQLGPWFQYKPAEAKKLLAEAGHPNGFSTTLFYYEYFPQMTSEVQLVQQDLKRNLNIDVKITKLDYTTYYGRYVESKWDGMCWGFQSGHGIGLDERTYQFLHSKSPKNFFRVNDPVIDDLCVKLRQTPDPAQQRALTKKLVEREFDQAYRLWMPYDNGFLVFQPHMRNVAAPALRRSDGYGASLLANAWLDK